MPCKPPGYYVECPQSHALIQLFGDLLEGLTANEKCGLIAALTLWLSMDDADDQHWDIPAIAHTNLFPESQNFSRAVAILESIQPNHAQALTAALIEQIREGIYS